MKRLATLAALSTLVTGASCGNDKPLEFINTGQEGLVAIVKTTDMPPPYFKFTGELLPDQKSISRLENIAINSEKQQYVEGSEINTTYLQKEQIPGLTPPRDNRQVLVCLLPGEQQPLTQDLRTLIANLQTVNEFYRENSFDNVGFTFHVVQGPTIVNSESFTWENLRGGAIRACDQFIDYHNVGTIIAYYPGQLDGFMNTFKSQGITTGQTVYTTADGTVPLTISGILGEFNWRTISHELGHGFSPGDGEFSISHANGLNCEEYKWEYTPGCCDIINYGNLHDIMGRSEVGGHMNGYFKHLLGWSRKQNILNSGTYKLGVLEKPSSEAQVLHLPSQGVCLDFRRPLGFDDSAHFLRVLYTLEVYLKEGTRQMGTVEMLHLNKRMPETGAIFAYECGGIQTGDKGEGYTTSMIAVTSHKNYGYWFNIGRGYASLPRYPHKIPSLGITFSYERTKRDIAEVTVSF